MTRKKKNPVVEGIAKKLREEGAEVQIHYGNAFKVRKRGNTTTYQFKEPPPFIPKAVIFWTDPEEEKK